MDDSISRQAALSALNGLTEIYLNNLPPTIDKADAVGAVNALPSAQPVEDIHREKEQAYYCGYEDGAKAARSAQPGWIPCSRELPKKDGDYLVTTHSGQIARYIFIGGSSEEYWRRCATAWMPLPKPWEGDANDT